MPYETIQYEKCNHVGTIILNRPKKLNALNFELLDELWDLLQDIQDDTEVKVVVLTGAGDYFSAGADLSILSNLSPSTFRRYQDRYWNRVFGEIADMPKLTIAAINGPAIGGGVELALCCDLRYAVEDATFRMPQIHFGLLPDAGATTRLPWLMGPAKAKEFIFFGEALEAIQARSNGLVNDVFSRERFREEIRKKSETLAQKSMTALGLGKQLINRGAQQRDVKSGLEEVADVQTLLISSREYREGVDAYMGRLKKK